MNTNVFPEAVCQVNLITNTCFCPTGSNLHMLLLKEVSALATAHLEKSYKLSTKNNNKKNQKQHLTDNNYTRLIGIIRRERTEMKK